ncbi:MAG: sugar phosphate isomerase/epimerase family protein [Armatimonadota bacterium]
MKFAICNEMFEGWPFEDVCNAVSKIGYSGIEIAPFTFSRPISELSGQERTSIRHIAKDAGLSVVGFHWCLANTTGLHLTSPDKTVRDRTAEYLTELINLCADVGGEVLVFGSPKQRNLLPGVSAEQAHEYAIDVFRSIVPALENRGVTLALEPLSPTETDFVNTAAQAQEIIAEIGSPRFGLTLDVKAMSSESTPMEQIIRENKGSLKHFHANDANLRGPGFGDTDFTPVAAALNEVNYDGWVSVEVFDFSPDPITIATKSIQYLREVFETERSKL